MNVPLVRRTVRTERHIGSDVQQLVVEASFALPADMPDIARIVRLEARPVVTDRNAMEDEIVVHGAVDFVLVYAHDEEAPRPIRRPPEDDGGRREIEAERGYDPEGGYETGYDDEGRDLGGRYDEEGRDGGRRGGFEEDDGEEPEIREALYRHRWRRGATFEAIFDLPGSHPEAVADVRAEPLDVEVHLHGNGRGVDVEAVVAAAVRVVDYDERDVPVKGGDFPDGVAAEERTVNVEHVAAQGRTNVSVEGVLPLSSERPARTVVDVAAQARLEDLGFQVEPDGRGRIEGRGTVRYTAVVVDEQGGADAFAWEEQTPFTFALEGLDVYGDVADLTVSVEADATIRGLDAAVTEDGRGVSVFADVDVVARGAAVAPLRLVVSVEADGDDEVRSRAETFRLEEFVGRHARRAAATGQLDLPEGSPPVERLLGAEARVRVEDVLVLGDKVIVEGQFDVSGFYTARTDGDPIHFTRWDRAVPLEDEVAVTGAEPGMEADVKIDVVDVELDLLNRQSVEATVRFDIRARATHETERSAVVEAVAVPPPEADPPTFTFVVVQDDDTLWSLSHRYHTDVTDIVAANSWLESADAPLTPGRKLCVPRRKPAAPTSA